jgi:hypothetical protein
MLGDGQAADRKMVGHIVQIERPACEQMNDLAPGRIRNSLKNIASGLVHRFCTALKKEMETVWFPNIMKPYGFQKNARIFLEKPGPVPSDSVVS